MSKVIVYSRPSCSLCDRATAVLHDEGIDFEEIDISSDPGLTAEFGYLIPVVEVDGRTVFEGGMDPLELPSLIAKP